MAYQAVSVTKMSNQQVLGLNGEKLGIIEDIVMDVDGRAFHHVIILRRGGILGTPLGAQHYAFPLSDVTICADGQCCRLDLTEEQLELLPQIDGKDYSWSAEPLKHHRMRQAAGENFAVTGLDFAKQR
ncbi:PRC-barrel domain-containing protein [Kordiimonas sp.]|uniref:PRC-barrel domain-containing protein n=1 Tax=Kordiimonas sp. TaxID=1970157 RepID=UPI003A9164AB